ncbi:MAG TPA: hypothetical protein VKR61_25435 [Bryobacteraceae bacterium]|nr:hypothetical protein [Bryobacteraceae bacterium]
MAISNNVSDDDSGRRARHRFPIEQEVRYQCVKGSRITAAGAGKTLEMSSREVRFTTEHNLKPGQKVRIAVDWPAMLDNTCLMKLEIFGWVIHSEPDKASVKIERYEFRTRGIPLVMCQSGWAG